MDASEDVVRRAQNRVDRFWRGQDTTVSFWSGGGEALDRWQLRKYLSKFGPIIKLFLRPDSKEGFVNFGEQANVCAAAERIETVAGGSRVMFKRRSLPRVFLGGLNPRAKEETVKAAVALFGQVVKFERKIRKGRPVGYCLLTFLKRQEILRMLQLNRIEVLGRKVSVRMEGELVEPDDIYDYDRSWQEGRTMLVYGFSDPDEVSVHDVIVELSKYGKVISAKFVFRGGRRQPLCFVDFEDSNSVNAAMKLSASCIRGQITGFMVVTRTYLDAITCKPKVRVTEDPLDDDLDVPLLKDYDISEQEKEEVLRRAVLLVDAVRKAFRPAMGSKLARLFKSLAHVAKTESEEENVERESCDKRKREGVISMRTTKRLCTERYSSLKAVGLHLVRQCFRQRKDKRPELDALVQQLQQQPLPVPEPVVDTVVKTDCSKWENFRPGDEDAKLFIQNLPENVTRKKVLKHFSTFGDVVHLFLAPQGNRGCVMYDFTEEAQRALAQENHMISGHEIRVLKAVQGVWPQVFVGNLPQGATKEEIMCVMAVFGAVKDVFLPKDKNYGFVSYSNVDTVDKAVVCGHAFLSGRRLFVHHTRKRN